MKIAALLLAVVVAFCAAPVRAEEVVQPATKQRGFMTGLGLGFLIGGLAGIGLGVGGLVSANDAAERISRYNSLTALQRDGLGVLKARLESSTALAAGGFVGGAIAMTAAIIFILVDRPTPSVAFVPTSRGGALVFSGRF